MRRSAYVFSAVLLLLSCRNPVHELDPDLSTLRVRTEPAAASRTVVPDFSKQFDSLLISLTSNNGYAAPASQTDTAAPWQVGFSVQPGSWNIQVLALRSGAPVGSGTKTVTLASGLVDPVIVPLTFDAGATTGDVRFAVSFPSGLGINYVHGLIVETLDDFEPTLTTSGGRRSGTFEISGLAPSPPGEAYTLVLTFKRGGSAGTLAGVFREKIIVVGGFTSGSWVGPGGEILAERAFSEDEFYSPEAALAGLSISDGVFPAASFNPAVLDYDQGTLAGLPDSVTFTATAVPGQSLEYSWNEEPFEVIRSNVASPALDADAFNTLEVRVTAPDRETNHTYTVSFIKDGGTYLLTVPGGTIELTLKGEEMAVTGRSGTSTDVVIPATVAGFPVTEIADNAFTEDISMTSVTIPDSVKTIGDSAFNGCLGLTSFTVPDSVANIGSYAFHGCDALTSLTLPNNAAFTTIYNHSFANCDKLTTITIPNSVTSIGIGAFQHCVSLPLIAIPNSVKNIEGYSFLGCKALVEVTIPASVNTIGTVAFSECSGLSSVHVQATTPPSVQYGAFSLNAAGRTIYVPMASVSTYKAASGWSTYAANIVGE